MTTPDSTQIAAQIYIRVCTEQILAKPKTWMLKDKEAAGIAQAALHAAQAFAKELNALAPTEGEALP